MLNQCYGSGTVDVNKSSTCRHTLMMHEVIESSAPKCVSVIVFPIKRLVVLLRLLRICNYYSVSVSNELIISLSNVSLT